MKSISILTQEMQEVLTTNILPYWMERMVDEQYGGFYGCITCLLYTSDAADEL